MSTPSARRTRCRSSRSPTTSWDGSVTSRPTATRAIGGLVTAVDRRLDDPDPRRMLRSSAYLGGVDLNHYWGNQRWALDAFVTGSLVQGDPAAIAAHPALAGPLLPAARRRALLAGHDPDLAGGLQRGGLADQALGPLARQRHAAGQEPGLRDQRRGLRGLHQPARGGDRHRLRRVPAGPSVPELPGGSCSPPTSGTTTGTGSPSTSGSTRRSGSRTSGRPGSSRTSTRPRATTISRAAARSRSRHPHAS